MTLWTLFFKCSKTVKDAESEYDKFFIIFSRICWQYMR